MVRKRTINLLLIIFFLLEGTAFHYLSPSYYGSNITFVPRFVLAIIIFIAIFKDKQYALFLGIAFGILQDLVYGDVLGLYMVGLAGIGYFSGWLTQFFQSTFLIYSIIQGLGFLTLDLYLYGMLTLYHLSDNQFNWTFIHVLLPSLFIHLLFSMIIYKPMKFLIEEKD